ncbi:uncharacterized protein JN550_002942 [Neoarthrinium moseri]|uniref:uncharacterized protein n=1 Tax=Neoarthrinium moseri TaxID=1658444 RepID=UPI001FDBB2F6|nr:uncharacterized protein JN550_002942 [Neoarthrinium moseri]KAI1873673.1 hypothetical protein JN550_002942 [Neoarthrinium moseri]
MTREKKKPPLPARGDAAKDRHNKASRMRNADPTIYNGLNAYKQPPPQMKHKSYFVIADNTDRKEKKLETKVTVDRNPPPGFEFIAAGNPQLSKLCKELSREQDAMIFIVSESNGKTLSDELQRLGYHFRQRIVDQAREMLLEHGHTDRARFTIPGRPEVIPEDKEKMMREADAVLRDLFPRIPHTDRAEILLQSFNQANKYFNGSLKVGMNQSMPLARRVQLAAISHIRHTKTRYDELLREGQKWENARKAVEKPCLDIIVKWRGDEETGRDQLDEILQEVIEISDSEGDSEDEYSSEEAIVPNPVGLRARMSPVAARTSHAVQEPVRITEAPTQGQPREPSVILLSPGQPKKTNRKERKAAKKANQRFKRYYQVAETFRQEPHAPPEPPSEVAAGDDFPAGETIHRFGDSRSLQATSSSHIPVSGEGIPQGARLHYDPYAGSPRYREDVTREAMRRQSPLVGHGNGIPPQVGFVSDRQRHDHVPLSPAKHQLHDMLVPFIEPRSPGVVQNRDQPPSYFSHRFEPHAEPPRIVTRSIVHQPSGAARPASPEYLSGLEDLSIKRRRVVSQAESSGLFSNGFIQVNRRPEQVVEHTAGRPISYPIPVSREAQPRPRSPVRYVHRPLEVGREEHRANPVVLNRSDWSGQDEVAYRSRAHPIYVGEPTHPTRENAAVRSSNNPIVLDSPRTVGRYIEPHQPSDKLDQYRLPPARPEAIRDVPVREIRHFVDGRPVIYVNEPDPRAFRAQETSRGYSGPLYSQDRTFAYHADPHSYQAPPARDAFDQARHYTEANPRLIAPSHGSMGRGVMDDRMPRPMSPRQGTYEAHYVRDSPQRGWNAAGEAPASYTIAHPPR